MMRPRGLPGAPTVTRLPANAEDAVPCPVWEDPTGPGSVSPGAQLLSLPLSLRSAAEKQTQRAACTARRASPGDQRPAPPPAEMTR